MVVGIIVLLVGVNATSSISGKIGIVKKNNTLGIDTKDNRVNNNIKNNKIQKNFVDYPPEEEWNKTFGGSKQDTGNSVQQTSDDGYILAGHTKSLGDGSGDFWLIKTDELGIEQWNKTYSGKSGDFANSVLQTSDGGYILLGDTIV